LIKDPDFLTSINLHSEALGNVQKFFQNFYFPSLAATVLHPSSPAPRMMARVCEETGGTKQTGASMVILAPSTSKVRVTTVAAGSLQK
jgi:hypothetical protein